MAPITSGLLDQVIKVLESNAQVSTNEKISTLQTFATTLNEPLSLEKSIEVLNVVPLSLLYNGFSVEDEQLTRVLCQVIDGLLKPFSFDQIMTPENQMFLLQGLSHFTADIRYLSLQQVTKCLNSNQSVGQMIDSDIFPLIVATIAFQDTKTANKASDILYKMCFQTVGQDAFFSPTCFSMLEQLLQVSDVIRFRVYDLVIKVASISDETFERCEASQMLAAFINELGSDDLLVKINAIELLNQIAVTCAGVSFLEKANLLNTISAVLDNADDDDIFTQLVKSSVLKFFGNLGEKEEVDIDIVVSKYHLLERLEKNLESTNAEIKIVTISTIGLLGSHAKGLKLIQPLTKNLSEIYSSSIGQIKTVSLQTLSKLLAVKKDQEIEDITLNVYNQLEGRPTALSSLIKEAKQPDDDHRVAAFAVMQAIAYHIWGNELMSQSTEYMEYILNRSTEYTELGQSWKFAIIQTMAQVPNAAQLFGQTYYAQIQVYLRQGAHYRTVEPVAAVENN